MTPYFLSSVTGNDANDGLSWATAKATAQAIYNLSYPADAFVYVDSGHTGQIGTQVPANLGDYAEILTFLSVDRSQWPTVVEKAGGQINFYATNQTINGGCNLRGLTINLSTAAANGAGNGFSAPSKSQVVIEVCQFLGGQLQLGNGAASNGYGAISIYDTTHKPSIAAGYLNIGNGIIRWYGGGFASGSYAITQLLAFPTSAMVDFVMEGADLSALPANMAITASGGAGKAVLKNCKMPPGWLGALFSNSCAINQTVELYNCDSGATTYRIYIGQYAGTLRESTAVLKSGGATDGTTAMSWAISTNGNCRPPDNGGPPYSFVTPEIAYWNEAISAQVTASVDVLADTSPLTSSEAWLEVTYLGDSASPKSLPAITRTKLGGTAVAHPSSPASWSAASASPQVQRLQFTFTPKLKGFVIVRVRIARPSATVYVDPTMTIA
jgi:hypothetical protein